MLSVALIVEPLSVNAPITTFPVPLGCMEMSALLPFDEMLFVVSEPVDVSPAIVAPPERVVGPVTANDELNVVASVTANVELNVVAPVTPKVELNDAADESTI